MSKWIYYRYSSPGKSVLEVFRDQEAASVLSRHRQNQRVPNLELMVGYKIKSRLKGIPG